MSRWTQGSTVDELLEELRGRDRPSPLAAHVLQVGDVALELLLVVVVERQPPGPLARLRGRPRARLWANGSSLREEPGDLGTQRDHARSGERGQVEDPAGLILGGEAEGVGQDEPSLGVGVQDLDGLAVPHGEDVAELHGLAAGHVLGQGQIARDD